MSLYPAIIECLREEGLNAEPHNIGQDCFSIIITHNKNNYEFIIPDDTNKLVYTLRRSSLVLGIFDLADPKVFKKIKESIEKQFNPSDLPRKANLIEQIINRQVIRAYNKAYNK